MWSSVVLVHMHDFFSTQNNFFSVYITVFLSRDRIIERSYLQHVSPHETWHWVMSHLNHKNWKELLLSPKFIFYIQREGKKHWPSRWKILSIQYLWPRICDLYEVCPESIQQVIWKIETSIEDTRYNKHCTQDNDASVPFKVGTLGPHTILPITINCLIIYLWILPMVWNLFFFKGDFSFEKSQKMQCTKSGL